MARAKNVGQEGEFHVYATVRALLVFLLARSHRLRGEVKTVFEFQVRYRPSLLAAAVLMVPMVALLKLLRQDELQLFWVTADVVLQVEDLVPKQYAVVPKL